MNCPIASTGSDPIESIASSRSEQSASRKGSHLTGLVGCDHAVHDPADATVARLAHAIERLKIRVDVGGPHRSPEAIDVGERIRDRRSTRQIERSVGSVHAMYGVIS